VCYFGAQKRCVSRKRCVIGVRCAILKGVLSSKGVLSFKGVLIEHTLPFLKGVLAKGVLQNTPFAYTVFCSAHLGVFCSTPWCVL
jgi:hypothetical protein